MPDDGFFKSDHCLVLGRAIDDLAQAVKDATAWFKSQAQCATKTDLQETERRILEAIGSADPAKIAQLTAELKTDADTLKTAVDNAGAK